MIFKLFYKTNPTFCRKIICLAESPYRSPDVSEFQGSGIRLARARDLLPSRLLDVVERRQAGHLVRLFECRLVSGRNGWLDVLRPADAGVATGAASGRGDAVSALGCRLMPAKPRPYRRLLDQAKTGAVASTRSKINHDVAFGV